LRLVHDMIHSGSGENPAGAFRPRRPVRCCGV
jgi:hypothetical protein